MPVLTLDSEEFRDLAAAILAEGSTLRFCARGSSMEPFIYDGDIVEVQPLDGPDVRVGDILLACVASDRLVVHRAVARDCGTGSPTVLLQGDSVAQPDGYLSLGQVMGRASAVERNGRRRSLDRGLWRWIGLLWTKTRPLSGRVLGRTRSLRVRWRRLWPARPNLRGSDAD